MHLSCAPLHAQYKKITLYCEYYGDNNVYYCMQIKTEAA